MKASGLARIFISIVFILSVVGCAPSEAQIREAIAKTQTAAPTLTPTATATLVPTNTATPVPTATNTPTTAPTPTSLPAITGIDEPVSMSKGVTFQFDSVVLTSEPVVVGDTKMVPNPGRTNLVLNGFYTGNYDTFMKYLLANPDNFYITDQTRTKHFGWIAANFLNSGTFTFGFFVMSDNGPYILHYDLDPSWTLDLSPLLSESSGTNL